MSPRGIAQMVGKRAKAAGLPHIHPHHDQPVTDQDFKAALRSIGLRTIDLSPARPRAGIERHLREALGVQPSDPIDIPLPPVPGRGLDGPDLGP